jgi:hypothetical protein
MRKIVLITAAGLLGVAAPAAALTSANATPDKAGRPSSLHFDIDGTAAPISGRIPLTLQLTTLPGFRVNLQAVARRCSQESATLNECPAASRVGKGSLVVGVTTPTQFKVVTIPLSVYLHSNTKILAVAKVFGWQVVPATLNARRGLSVRFDPLPQGPPFQGVTYALKRIKLDFGATDVVHEQRQSLIRNPPTCKGRWAASVKLTFKAGPAVSLTTSTACSKS